MRGMPGRLYTNESGVFREALQSPFRFESMDLPTIRHRDSYSVFKRIDFFSVLQGLIVSLGVSLSYSWTLECPEISQVWSDPFRSRFTSTYRVQLNVNFAGFRPSSIANLISFLYLTCVTNYSHTGQKYLPTSANTVNHMRCEGSRTRLLISFYAS